MMKVSEKDKRSVSCPKCGAPKGRPCKSSRIPGANTLGGGWGGCPDLDTAHTERRAEYLRLQASFSVKLAEVSS